MLVVVMGFGDRIRHVFDEPVVRRDIDNTLKNLYVRHQSQEMYVRTATRDVWFKPDFKFQVTASGMHPKSVALQVVPDDAVPGVVRMHHLVGAL
jgi:hypothetical protein